MVGRGPAAQVPMTRDEWIESNLPYFETSCVDAYKTGNYGFVTSALQANREALADYITEHENGQSRSATVNDVYMIFKMAAKTNTAALSIVDREETTTAELRERMRQLELLGE